MTFTISLGRRINKNCMTVNQRSKWFKTSEFDLQQVHPIIIDLRKRQEFD